ncbi:conserved membrane [Cordyceps militaris]|uniref:Conserved membrane n=1 Tax=Cordyceps militaris TaxID=73501 RepID=A0A2H4SDU8_CORMI|nr:conserved membrane [Cordyceps militaris]
MASTTAPAPAPPPLLIIVRFSNGLPDLTTDVPLPHTTTVLAFQHGLRARIASRGRLRLIYQGRILPSAASLASVLKPLPAAPPPPPPDTKGKAVDKPPAVRVYLNCSIGDELTTAELDAEEADAAKPPEGGGEVAAPGTAGKKPRPRGFDRLLQAGFTASDIATLRTQFASIHTERFASDAVPSPDTMRGMEEAWIDGNAGELPSSTPAGPLDDDITNLSSVLDVLIRAMMIGFFFPLGTMTWLLRQDVWGEKWRIFVGSGVVLSLTVGIFMTMGSER